MIKKKAKLIYKHNYFEIEEEGDHVLCAISGKEILLQDLNYWNVDLQEAYFSPVEVNKKFKTEKKITTISSDYESKSIDQDFLRSYFPISCLTLL